VPWGAGHAGLSNNFLIMRCAQRCRLCSRELVMNCSNCLQHIYPLNHLCVIRQRTEPVPLLDCWHATCEVVLSKDMVRVQTIVETKAKCPGLNREFHDVAHGVPLLARNESLEGSHAINSSYISTPRTSALCKFVETESPGSLGTDLWHACDLWVICLCRLRSCESRLIGVTRGSCIRDQRI